MLAHRLYMAAAGVGGVKIPVGLILLHNSAAIPSGWQRFSAADGRMIVGAGGSYGVGAMGGSWSTGAIGSTSAGGHSGHGGKTITLYSGVYEAFQNVSEGAHSHTVTTTYYPNRQRVIFIKSISETVKLPVGAVVLADANIAGLGAATFANGYWPFGGPDWSAFAASASGAVGAAGSHEHARQMGYAVGGGPTGATAAYANGSHAGHTASVSVTSNALKYVALRAMAVAVEQGLVEGVIGLWEGAAIPGGWTELVDFRDYYLQLNSAGTGQRGGTNQLTVSGSLGSDAWSHSHYSGMTYGQSQNGTTYVDTYSATHSHSFSGAVSYLPPFIALKAIKYTG